jgi:hypothetical protein
MNESRTSQEWWNEVKADPEKLVSWLKRQYVGEIAAVNLLSEVLLRFGGAATDDQWDTVYRVMVQEAKHGRWMKELMDTRHIQAEVGSGAERRYWKEVLPHVNSFPEAMAAAFHAENMRLERIRCIAADAEAPEDIRKVFQRILPDEEWHEQVFGEMRDGLSLTQYHAKGLEALNLTLA